MRKELHLLLSALLEPPRTVVACAELARRVHAVHVSFAVTFPGDDEQADLAHVLVALVDLQLETAAMVDCQYVLAPLAVAMFGDNDASKSFVEKIGAERERSRQARTIIPEPDQTTPMNEQPTVVGADKPSDDGYPPAPPDELEEELKALVALASRGSEGAKVTAEFSYVQLQRLLNALQLSM